MHYLAGNGLREGSRHFDNIVEEEYEEGMGGNDGTVAGMRKTKPQKQARLYTARRTLNPEQVIRASHHNP
jgi:hypothetical protein